MKNKKKKIEKLTEPWDLWDNIKMSGIHVIRVPEEKKILVQEK